MSTHPACAGRMAWWEDVWAASILGNEHCDAAAAEFRNALGQNASTNHLLAVLHVALQQILLHRVEAHSNNAHVQNCIEIMNGYPFAEPHKVPAYLSTIMNTSELSSVCRVRKSSSNGFKGSRLRSSRCGGVINTRGARGNKRSKRTKCTRPRNQPPSQD